MRLGWLLFYLLAGCQSVPEIEAETYVVCRIVQAEPMREGEFLEGKGYPRFSNSAMMDGYRVTSAEWKPFWIPASEFRRGYRRLSPEEKALLK